MDNEEMQTLVKLSNTNFKVARLSLVIALSALLITIINAVPMGKIGMSKQAYICTEKQTRHTNNNVTLIEEGFFSKTCTTSKKKGKKTNGDCGEQLSQLIKKGFICKKTGLDLE